MANAVDKEQIEMLAKWWKAYGKPIAAGVVFAVIIIFTWKYWGQYKTHQEMAASGIYQDIFAAAKEHDLASVSKSVELLEQNYASTPYAALGAMMAARLFVEANRLDDAVTHLSWVINHAPVNSFKQIARINEARIFIAQKNYVAAEMNLSKLDDPAFQAYVDDVRGQLYAAKGDTAAAKEAFASAKRGFQEANMTDALVDMQLNSLPHS